MIPEKTKYTILTFANTHNVLKAEKLLLSRGVSLEIIPTPRDISSDCGMAIRLKTGTLSVQQLNTILDDKKVAFNIHER